MCCFSSLCVHILHCHSTDGQTDERSEDNEIRRAVFKDFRLHDGLARFVSVGYRDAATAAVFCYIDVESND